MRVHFLDKIKYELNKRNPYQYFYQFWKYNTLFEHKDLERSIQKVYQAHKRLQHYMVEENGQYHYKSTHFETIYFNYTTHNKDLEKEVDHFMTNYSNDYIIKSKEAPFILVNINNSNNSLLLFLHNHIYYDGFTGHQMVKHFWDCYENKAIDSVEDEWLDDQQMLEKLKTQNKNFNSLYYFQALAKHAFRSSKITGNKNVIKKIYQQDQPSKVLFKHLYIQKDQFEKYHNKYSSNTIICAILSDLFLSKKGHQTDNHIAISIPWNIRERENTNLGNCVSSISVKLHKKQSTEDKCEIIHQAVDTFKELHYSRASYHLSCVITKNKVKEELLKPFIKISQKHHCYISNHGRLTSVEQHPNLVSSGGFNYPLQEQYGLVFTITPNKDEYCIGIASSDQIFTQEELENFKFKKQASPIKCN